MVLTSNEQRRDGQMMIFSSVNHTSCTFLCMSVRVDALGLWVICAGGCSQRPGEEAKFPKAGVLCICEPPDTSAGTKLQFSERAASSLNH